MTYKEFKMGLYVKYHMSYLRSVLFIKSDKLKGKSVSGWEDLIILKVDAERILKKLTNRNMGKALCLIAQGYSECEVAEILDRTDRMIRYYISNMKKFLKNIS